MRIISSFPDTSNSKRINSQNVSPRKLASQELSKETVNFSGSTGFFRSFFLRLKPNNKEASPILEIASTQAKNGVFCAGDNFFLKNIDQNQKYEFKLFSLDGTLLKSADEHSPVIVTPSAKKEKGSVLLLNGSSPINIVRLTSYWEKGMSVIYAYAHDMKIAERFRLPEMTKEIQREAVDFINDMKVESNSLSMSYSATLERQKYMDTFLNKFGIARESYVPNNQGVFEKTPIKASKMVEVQLIKDGELLDNLICIPNGGCHVYSPWGERIYGQRNENPGIFAFDSMENNILLLSRKDALKADDLATYWGHGASRLFYYSQNEKKADVFTFPDFKEKKHRIKIRNFFIDAIDNIKKDATGKTIDTDTSRRQLFEAFAKKMNIKHETYSFKEDCYWDKLEQVSYEH